MKQKFKHMKILIDAGHGIDTPGKESPDRRLQEYEWARDIAQRLEARLKEKGHDAQRIVPESNDVSITARCKRVNDICNQLGAKNVVLVSIHNNAAGNGSWNSAKGFSVFVSKNASSNSKKLASIFTDEGIERNMMGNRSIPACKYWTWSWTKNDIGILKGTACPAVLTENGFMDNKEECDYLLSEKGKQDFVDLHVAAIEKYVKSL